MATRKLQPSMDEKVARVLKEAEEIYLRHFGQDVMPDAPALTEEQVDAAVFGYLYGLSFSDNVLIREVAYNAMQKRFGWDDEYIATMVIGG